VVHDEVSFQMRVSLGVAAVRDDEASHERWVSAPTGLYRAKQGGRNRTAVDQPG
jgi:PleD family two-component response regulator